MWKYFPLEVKRDKLHKIEHMYGYLKKQARFSRKSLAKTGKTIFTKCFFFAISLFEQQSWYMYWRRIVVLPFVRIRSAALSTKGLALGHNLSDYKVARIHLTAEEPWDQNITFLKFAKKMPPSFSPKCDV